MSRRFTFIAIAALSVGLLASCGAATSVPLTTTMPPAASDTADVGANQESASLPLSEPGPYHTGTRTVAYQDPGRAGRQVSITVWYPAVLPEGSTAIGRQACSDCEPDRGGAPYPLILSSTKLAKIMAPYLISHGFTWASIDGIDTYEQTKR